MNLENFTDPQKWALEQWGDVDLGDSRRTNRAVEVGAALAQNPSASLPTQMESWNQLKAAYRLLGEKDVTHKALSQPHCSSTLCQAQLSWRTNRTVYPRHNGIRLYIEEAHSRFRAYWGW